MSTQNIENELRQIRRQLTRIADHLAKPAPKTDEPDYEQDGVTVI